MTDRLQPQVGYWAMQCCEHDLHRIEDESEVQEILESWADNAEMDETFCDDQVFATREDAWDVIFPYTYIDAASWTEIRVHRPLTLADIRT